MPKPKSKRTARKRDTHKQAQLEGMEPPSIPAIDRAADYYRETRDQRMQDLDVEIKAKARLMELMKEHALITYEYEGWIVSRESVDGVKVRKKKEPTANGDGDE